MSEGTRMMLKSIEGRPHLEDDVALDLKAILGAVWRRRLIIAAATLGVAVGTFVVLSLIPPRFQAETKILIENREVDITRDRQNGSDRGTVDAETVTSQVQLLTSRDLARRVAETLKLGESAEFNGSGSGILQSVLATVGLGRDPMRVSAEERVLDTFMEHLTVYRVEGSRVVVVQFASRDRELAATAANTIAAKYMELQAEAKRRTSEDQTRWLGEEIETLRVKVRDAEAATERYRSGSDLIVGENNTSIARQQITDIGNSVAAARADQTAAESKAAQLRALLKDGGNLETAAAVIDSDTFRALRAREIALRSRLSELSVTLLPGHPQIKALNSQVGDIVSQQAAEARRVLATLDADAKVAAARIVSLENSLTALKATSAQDNRSEVDLRALEREATSQRELLESMLSRYREAVARQNAGVLPADARVISRAATPAEPTFPKVVPFTIVATLAAFLIFISGIITTEFMSGQALQRLSAAPVSPRVLREPDRVEADPKPRREPEPKAVRAPAAAPSVDERLARFKARVAEATAQSHATDESAARPHRRRVATPLQVLEGLHAMLIADGAVRVAVVGVGAASDVERMVATFSKLSTDEGDRLVVVDAVPAHAGIGGAGLTDLINGKAAFSEIIRRNPSTRAHEIGVGREPLSEAMLDDGGFETMLTALEHTYDLVLMDLGVIAPDPSRLRLITMADHAVLVGDAEDPDVSEAFEVLTRAGVQRMSVVPVPDGGHVDEAA